MTTKIEINNGRLVDAANKLDQVQSLYIDGDRIAAIGAAPAGWKADKVIDASGKLICPGLIDLCARLREPGLEHKATLESELLAAVAGGVTALVCPPDTDPVLDEPGLVEMLKRRAGAIDQARVYPLGALTAGLQGEKLTEMVELTEAGCIGFTNANQPIVDTVVLYRAMQYAATYGYAVWLRPEEAHLARGGMAHDGEVASRLGLAGIPVSAETVAIATIVMLMRDTGARVHLARLSSRLGVDLVRAAKAEGLPLTCDVGIHHLLLSDRDIGHFDSQYRFAPPLRSPSDRDALSRGVIDGTIDAICSDHSPVDDDAKHVPFGEAEPGATGLEMLLPLTLKWAAAAGVSTPAALHKVTGCAARLLGLDSG
ncbi:MAG: dihydroorotase, partial [Burkholderiales bacterium]|nr:dihydroorotase [Burkholderiales bacterium]